MISKKNFMIVSGNGRNTGKTSFVEGVLKNNSREYSITAIKVSPHFHPAKGSDHLLVATDHFTVSEENDRAGSKDSSRMLRAGASRVYYIQAKDEHLEEAFQAITEIADLSEAVICESGGMRKFVEPSLFIALNRPDLKGQSESFAMLSPVADKIVQFENGTFDLLPEEVVCNGKRWEIRDQISDSEI